MDWTKLFECIITIVSLLVSGFLIPWLKSKIESDKLQKILTMVDIAVGAAEQLAANEGYDGEWKKNYVQNYLSTKGIDLDADTINNMIENAVIELHNELKEKA